MGIRSSKVLAGSIPMQDHVDQVSRTIDDYRACDSLDISNTFWSRDTIEPKTGITFPSVLDSSLCGEDSSRLTTEVFPPKSVTLFIIAIHFRFIGIQLRA